MRKLSERMKKSAHMAVVAIAVWMAGQPGVFQPTPQ